MVELEVSSADKQGKDFTQVQGPRVEVTPLRPACLLLLCEYDGHKSPGEMSISRFGSSESTWSGSMALPVVKY